MLGWFKRRKDDPKELLRQALGDFDLPSFPAVVLDAMRSLRDPNAPLSEISDKISVDPGVSARLLRLCNAPAFGVRHPVRNVHHAVSLLGRGQVESLLLSVAVKESLPMEHTPGIEPRQFWRTAARRATTARSLAAVLHPATRSESFTAALLQDMALPLLAHAQGDRYGQLLREWSEGGGCLASLEQAEFGWDHGEVGGSVCRTWKFPDTLTGAIGAHHDTEGSTALEAPPAVGLVAELRASDEEAPEALVVAVTERYGVSSDQVVAVVQKGFEEAEDLAASMAA